MEILKATDPMPWGVYKGLPMNDVPASYMFFLWTKNGLEDRTDCPVAEYIRRNLARFEKEHPDGIWKKPTPRTRRPL